MYMLDTNMCIYILKVRPLSLKKKFESVSEISISSVVYAELCFGVEASPVHLQEPRWQQLQQFLANLRVEPWDKKAAKHYGNIRAYLKQAGTPIGNMDMLIAAHARGLEAILVTNNVREFQRVPDLRIENWL